MKGRNQERQKKAMFAKMRKVYPTLPGQASAVELKGKHLYANFYRHPEGDTLAFGALRSHDELEGGIGKKKGRVFTTAFKRSK